MCVDERWRGDLRLLSTQSWADETTDVVAVAVASEGRAFVWMNAYHVRDCDLRIVWHWARHAAAYRAPLDVLYAESLAELHRQHLRASHEV